MELTRGQRAALDKVHALGMKDRLEHLIVLRGDEEIALIDGEEGRVDVGPALEARTIQKGDIIVHNHPGLNSLSNVDVLLNVRNSLEAVFAISDDGSVYKATTNPDSGGALRAALMSFAFDHTFQELVSNDVAIVAKELHMQRRPSDPEGFSEAHYLNMRMAHDGWFNYEYQLGEKTQALVNKLDSRLNKEGKSWWIK